MQEGWCAFWRWYCCVFLWLMQWFLRTVVGWCLAIDHEEMRLGRLQQFPNEKKKSILLIDFWNLFSGEYLDILAISCDSFNEEVNVLIGRGQGKKNHVENLHKLRQWCRDYAVAFKINSVINRFNVEEDMNDQIKALNPVRWKVRK